MRKRSYRLGRRAEGLESTRRRITRAAMELHVARGPGRTTIDAIAKRARVQRLTVYRHFPSLRLLFEACAGLHHELHPPPDPSRWASAGDPERRLRLGLGEMYAYYARTASMWANVLRDAETNVLVRESARKGAAFMNAARAALAEGWVTVPGGRRLLDSALSHALSFRTWESLVRQQELRPREAGDVMVSLVRAAAGPAPRRAREGSGRARGDLGTEPAPGAARGR